MKVLITEPIAEEGLSILRQQAEVDVRVGIKPDELKAIIGQYDALIVRSQTQVSAEVIKAGQKLQVIARAGAGVDNIDMDEATLQGIVVVNAPTGNTISAAEHTIALMLALARHIPQANTTLKSGVWRRNEFLGTEVRNKTLGIIGLGNVGSEVARRAKALEMRLIAYDPFVSPDYARNLEVEPVPLEQLLREADFITLHTPLTAQTKGLLGAKELALTKPTVRIINTARGGLVDEEALAQAIKEKRIAGAAFDVFSTEPITKCALFEEDNIIVTPHLGASTTEAQVMVARDVAEQVIEVFKGRPARYSVNAPFIAVENLATLAPFLKAASTAGRLVSQLVEGQMSTIQIKYDGEVANYDTKALKAAVLGGLLEGISEERVNLVNANVVASRRGLSVVEQKEATCENYSSLITVEAATSKGNITAAATVLRGETHIVRTNNYWLDISPAQGYFLFLDHLDRPGLMGAVGKITGDADINISAMYVSRLKPRGQALAVLALDEALSEKHLQQVLSISDVYSCKLIKL